MAQYPDPYRPALQAQIDSQTKQRAANLINISALESENAILNEMIELGQNTLDNINAELALPIPTNVEITESAPQQITLTWDDVQPGSIYQAEKDVTLTFDNPTQVFNAAYPPVGYIENAAGLSGQTLYYRVRTTQEVKDDSDWAAVSLTLA